MLPIPPDYFLRDLGWGREDGVKSDHELDVCRGCTTCEIIQFVLIGNMRNEKRRPEKRGD